MSTPYPRPRIHFTPERNWLNDPNGLVFVDGLWHIYFQYNPGGIDWGNMSWGHATSPDLQEWTEHPVALRFTDTEAVFSGSIVVDHANTSGFGEGDRAPLVAVFTSVLEDGRQAQSIAVSTDGGYVWERFAGNPVLDRGSKDFRDPKVFRAADRDGHERWVMVAVEAVLRQVVIYSSTDLVHWTFESSVGPHGPDDVVWECPDLFPAPGRWDSDDSSARPWIMLLSANQPADDGVSSMSYGVGRFDGHTFTPDADGPWPTVDHGDDFYAAVSFDNTGRADDPAAERVILAWADNWRYAAELPTEPWRGMMSLARRVTLETRGGRRMLVQTPLLSVPPGEETSSPDGRLDLVTGRHVALDVVWTFGTTPPLGGPAVVQVSLLASDGPAACTLRYHESTGELHLLRPGDDRVPGFAAHKRVAVPLEGGSLALTVIVDGVLVEVFADGGAVCLTELILPLPEARTVSVETLSGGASVRVTPSVF